MKVKLLKRWHAAGDAKPGDIVDIGDKAVRHGLDIGLCEKIAEKPKKQTTRNKGKGKKSS